MRTALVIFILAVLVRAASAQCNPYPDNGPFEDRGRIHRCSYPRGGMMWAMPDSYMRRTPGWMNFGGHNLYQDYPITNPHQYPLAPYMGIQRYMGPPPGTWGW